MPQILLILSKNIDTSTIKFQAFFSGLHELMGTVAKLDNRTCHSGLLQESFSYVGQGDATHTKVFLEIMWLETEERLAYRKPLADQIMKLLMEQLAPAIEAQGLSCRPRIRIANLGTVDEGYFIYK